MEIPKHWKEWTRITAIEPKETLTLAQLSFMLGEAITEDISRGATEFTVEIHKHEIIIACNKGDLESPIGDDPNQLYRSLFKKGE